MAGRQLEATKKGGSGSREWIKAQDIPSGRLVSLLTEALFPIFLFQN